MPTINYEASDFPATTGAVANGQASLSVTWPELVWSVVTVGKPGTAHLFAHGWHSVSDVIVRSHAVYAYLRNRGGELHRSSLYESLDPTEKGAASYFIGMMAAKIVAARLLQTPWLLHLSMFHASGGASIITGRSQPDLVGRNLSSGWVVLEAKGRSNGFSKVAIDKAKEQTKQLRLLNGVAPSLRVGVQAYFSSSLKLGIVDPSEPSENAVDLEIDENSVIRRYYSAFLEPVSVQSSVVTLDNRGFRLREVNEVGVSIGLEEDLVQLLQKDELVDFKTIRARDAVAGADAESRTQVFSDGVVIKLDERWSEENMISEPEARDGG